MRTRIGKMFRAGFWRDTPGQDLVEYALLAALVAAAGGAALWWFAKQGLLNNNTAAIAALVAGVVALLTWSLRQLFSAVVNRTMLKILEVLSSTPEPLSRPALRKLAASESLLARLFPEITTDALAALVTDKKVVIVSGKYTIAPGSDTTVLKTSL